jgi:hypothetical protein
MPAMQNRPKTCVPALEAIAGTVLAIVLISAALSLHWLAAYSSVAITLALLCCYGLYAIRHLRPLAYGTAEILIGAMLIVAAMQGAPAGLPNELDFWALVGKLAAGIYIIVRGLDNFAQSRFVAENDQARWLFECRWGGSGTRRS